ncbi:MAG: hypothetical protein P8K08_26255 [Fuerstiella sp.]|jgi:hypothetical protein|nr:hypothetical protein [Fuerstiella sp.]
MKTIVAWVLILWLALIFQVARPDVFVSGSLAVPLSVGCVFWLRTGTGVLLAGAALLIQWILHTTFAPIDVVVTLLLACAAISRDRSSDVASTLLPTGSRYAWLFQPTMVLCTGLIVHTLLIAEFQSETLWPLLMSSLCIGVPVLVLTLFIARTADQFGLRRRPIW